ncbi:hypothetical protein Taro_020713 [Colocasia esculenta]|uniref:Uncharacterized protein n=1 Tax=Colocasia esculenta TaxID=4460 RepID=A0A843V0D1_COLES|nr:hypothetical protein [Colocasia esculenta]
MIYPSPSILPIQAALTSQARVRSFAGGRVARFLKTGREQGGRRGLLPPSRFLLGGGQEAGRRGCQGGDGGVAAGRRSLWDRGQQAAQQRQQQRRGLRPSPPFLAPFASSSPSRGGQARLTGVTWEGTGGAGGGHPKQGRHRQQQGRLAAASPGGRGQRETTRALFNVPDPETLRTSQASCLTVSFNFEFPVKKYRAFRLPVPACRFPVNTHRSLALALALALHLNLADSQTAAHRLQKTLALLSAEQLHTSSPTVSRHSTALVCPLSTPATTMGVDEDPSPLLPPPPPSQTTKDLSQAPEYSTDPLELSASALTADLCRSSIPASALALSRSPPSPRTAPATPPPAPPKVLKHCSATVITVALQ